MKAKSISCLVVSDSFATLWAVAHQAPLSMGFPRQEYRSGLPFPSPRDLPNPGIKLGSPALQSDSLLSDPPGKPGGHGGGELMQVVWESCNPEFVDCSLHRRSLCLKNLKTRS